MANPNCFFVDEPFHPHVFRGRARRPPLIDVILNLSQCSVGGLLGMMRSDQFAVWAKWVLYGRRQNVDPAAPRERGAPPGTVPALAARLAGRCEAAGLVCVKSIRLQGQLRALAARARREGVPFQGLQLIRDPRYVLDSQRHMGWGRSARKGLEPSLERLCRDAEADTRAALEARTSEAHGLQHICYEDVASEPLAAAQRVYGSMAPRAAQALAAGQATRAGIPAGVWAFGSRYMAAWQGRGTEAPHSRGGSRGKGSYSRYSIAARSPEDIAKARAHRHTEREAAQLDAYFARHCRNLTLLVRCGKRPWPTALGGGD